MSTFEFKPVKIADKFIGTWKADSQLFDLFGEQSFEWTIAIDPNGNFEIRFDFESIDAVAPELIEECERVGFFETRDEAVSRCNELESKLLEMQNQLLVSV